MTYGAQGNGNSDCSTAKNPVALSIEITSPLPAKDEPKKTERQRKRDHARLMEFQAQKRKEANSSQQHQLNLKVNIAYNFLPVPQSSLSLEGQVSIETDEPMCADPQASTSASMEKPEPNSR